MALPKLPISVKSLAKAGQLLQEESQAAARARVLVDTTASRALIARARAVLTPQSDALELQLEALGDEHLRPGADVDFTVVIGGSSCHLSSLAEIALRLDMPCVFFVQSAAALLAGLTEEDALELAKNILVVDVLAPQTALEQDFCRWCLDCLPQLRLTLGAAFEYMRRAVALDLSKQAAFENAVLAAVFFPPGPDLPVLTLNQGKLLYRLALLHGVPLTRRQLVDFSLLMGMAFGCRAVARQAQKRLAPVAWLARAAVALGATLVVGDVAHRYYRQGGNLLGLLKQTEKR